MQQGETLPSAIQDTITSEIFNLTNEDGTGVGTYTNGDKTKTVKQNLKQLKSNNQYVSM